ncbi:MAG: 50S ribosomal protein L9 [Muribaculaceae bacterium]|nr:50S ribosomal protein L9 [Muribaculaceae bacterium]MDE6785791.1 50S ribosomal protein L9 [Muribaculaceae bacterium]
MKLILKENVVELGYKDDVVEVKDGYGRNYLIPQGKAVIASDANLKELQENLRQRAHKIAAILADAQAQADAIKDVTLTIEAKTGPNGVIYGSVAAAQIADAFAKLGHNIDRKLISLKNPIKVVGDYVCTVKFHRDVNAEVPVSVVAEATEE